MNSRVDITGGSAQLAWLKSDLAASGAACTIAYVYNPRFSSGTTHGSSTGMQPAWQVLYDGGVEVVVSGHEHNYERFAPQTPTGVADPVRGVREFIAGTGGSERQHQLRRAEADAQRRRLYLGVHSRRGVFVPGCGQRDLPLASSVVSRWPGVSRATPPS